MSENSNIRGWVARGGLTQDKINLTLAGEIDKLRDELDLMRKYVQVFKDHAVKLSAAPDCHLVLFENGEIDIRGKKITLRGSEEVDINTLGKFYLGGSLYRG